MKKAFVNVELEVVYFEACDIITTSEYIPESSTAPESSTGFPIDTGEGFIGEELPFN